MIFQTFFPEPKLYLGLQDGASGCTGAFYHVTSSTGSNTVGALWLNTKAGDLHVCVYIYIYIKFMHILRRARSSTVRAAERKVRKKNGKISNIPNHTFENTTDEK